MNSFVVKSSNAGGTRLRGWRRSARVMAGLAALAASGWVLSGCYYPAPVPVGYSAGAPASFDRSFAAASGAMRDQGLAINVEDRSSGTIVGRQGGATVTANVRTQADGSVRVQFDATGPRDPALIDRISHSYGSRMGR
jgi:hypothetical protein